MRRIAAVAVAIAAVLAAASPAAAGPADRGNRSVLNVFWYDREPVAPGAFRVTTWYVGVYTSSGSDWSDLYQDVQFCARAGDGVRCRQERYAYGDTDLTTPGDIFRMDTRDLRGAHLEARYRLQAYDGNGNPVGEPRVVHVLTDAVGVGDLDRSRSVYGYQSGCFWYLEVVRGASRSAVATGSIDGHDLGRTHDAYLANDAYRTVERSC